MRDTILARFERRAPLSAMMREAMAHALSPEIVDQVFEQHRQRPYSRELLLLPICSRFVFVGRGHGPDVAAGWALPGPG
jgi:hypothetical protein